MCGKDTIENIPDNTYGIEIEFGTHNCEMLSFTHIEVCKIYPAEKEDDALAWKIETDADYTLELVSPILLFKTNLEKENNAKAAREFKAMLMRFLEDRVLKGVLLVKLVDEIKNFIGKFNFSLSENERYWICKASDEEPGNLTLSEKYIVAKDSDDSLLANLEWFNWDEDTDLRQVLAAKQILASENGQDYWQKTQNTMLLTSCNKNDGLPSSQMNLPLSLAEYVAYGLKFKREKAWMRLLVTPSDYPEYTEKMKLKLIAAYPELAGLPGNPLWKDKYLGAKYLDEQIDIKIPLWHRYWLWLATFTRAASILLSAKPQEQAYNYKNHISYGIIKPKKNCNLKTAKKEIIKIAKKETDLISAVMMKENQLFYLTLQKLVTGTLGMMSEAQQGDAQKEVMAGEGYWNMDEILDKRPDRGYPARGFFHFHSELKDLTSLWFKSPLVEVIGKEEDGEEFKNKFKNLDPAVITDVIMTVLEANMSLLEWYYGRVNAAYKDEDEESDDIWDWEDFRSDNMPDTALFRSELLETCKQFQAYLNGTLAEPSEVLCTLNQLPQKDVIFLQRTYPSKGAIARWEGRWDTMKPPIPDADPQRYLVEHRNN